VTAYAGKVEFGQNVRTMLAMVVAEELGLQPAQVHVVLADTMLTPFDMGTFGSRSTPATVPPLRQAAAAARELLLTLGAEKLTVDRAKLTVADGKVTDPATHRSLGFGELTKGEELVQSIPADTPVIPPAQWRVEGKPALKVDAADVVTGSKKFASDFKRPGMLYAKVIRPPALPGIGATIKSADTSKAEAISGVLVCRDGDFLAVAAPSETIAEQAAAAVKVEWDHTPQVSEKELLDHLRKTAGPPPASTGALAAAMAEADVKLSETYTVSYVAHAAIEPRSGVAEFDGDNLTVWCATQSPFGVRSELARMFGMPETRIRVIALDTGCGFGGKTRGHAGLEAARIARMLKKPVRVAWTRQEEMTGTHFRPAGIIDISSGVQKDGALIAWEHHNYNSGPSGLGTPYHVPNQTVAFHPCDGPLPIGAYRALAAPVNFWARESHMDELAHALGMDPVEFRLKNATDPRLRAVIKAAAQRFGWRAKPAPGHGFGIAAGTEKGGYIATCVEIAVDSRGQVSVLRLVSAFECGAVINPLHLANQIEGGATMALGAALFEAIHFKDGAVLNSTFSDYRLPRFSDTPKIEAVILDRKDLPSAGAGEAQTCSVGGALANAIFNATGVRLRALPLVPGGMPK
jgi:isoquinoline 1-oxidoreductase